MKRIDQVFAGWTRRTIGTNNGNQKFARTMREFSDSTLDKVWGIKPQYTGFVIRRRPVVA